MRFKPIFEGCAKGSQNKKIVEDDFKPSDVIQGKLGDCWFVAAVSLLADHSYLLNKIIQTKIRSKKGGYQFKLFINGKWELVLIDSFIPCDKDQNFVFSQVSYFLNIVILLVQIFKT